MSRALIVLMAVALVGCVQAHDDSDMPDGRLSGMNVRSDNLTGCEYLTTPNGGITPRMNDDGKQVCRRFKR